MTENHLDNGYSYQPIKRNCDDPESNFHSFKNQKLWFALEQKREKQNEPNPILNHPVRLDSGVQGD